MAPDVNEMTETHQDLIKDYVAKHMINNNSFTIPFITEKYISETLNAMDVSKATGLDGISARFLKMSCKVISKPIEQIFNQSISQGIFPSMFKTAKVTPIFKKGSKSDKNNYRPISILPILSKVLEKHVSDHLKLYLESNNLLHMHQSGFRSNH